MIMRKKAFEEIYQKLQSCHFPEPFDMIIGIGKGGVVPAVLLANFLKAEIAIIWLAFRNEDNQICHAEPVLLREINFDFQNKKILLVDDRIKTGTTLQAAKKILSVAKSITTFAVNGPADYFLYNEECFIFPWKE